MVWVGFKRGGGVERKEEHGKDKSEGGEQDEGEKNGDVFVVSMVTVVGKIEKARILAALSIKHAGSAPPSISLPSPLAPGPWIPAPGAG